MFHSNHSSSPAASLSREDLQMLDRINASGTERVFFQNVHKVLASLFRIAFDVLSVAVLLRIKLADCHFLSNRVNAVIEVFLYRLFLFTE